MEFVLSHRDGRELASVTGSHVSIDPTASAEELREALRVALLTVAAAGTSPGAKVVPEPPAPDPLAIDGGVSVAWLENQGADIFDVVLLEGRRRARQVFGDPSLWYRLEAIRGDGFRRGTIRKRDVDAKGQPIAGGYVSNVPPEIIPVVDVDSVTLPGGVHLVEGVDYHAIAGRCYFSMAGMEKLQASGAITTDKVRAAALDDSARFGFTPAPEPPPSAPETLAAAAMVVTDENATILPELRPLVERITELDADEREEVFKLYNLVDDATLQTIRREHPSKAAADAAIIRVALVKAWGNGGEASAPILRNLSSVVDRRLTAQRMADQGRRNQPPGA